MLTHKNARILVISASETENEIIQDLMKKLGFDLEKCKFVTGKIWPTDGFHFAIFNALNLPRITSKDMPLVDLDKSYLELLEAYHQTSIPYIIYYGAFLYNLNQERCPSANSKFTLFARVNELINFINHYNAT